MSDTSEQVWLAKFHEGDRQLLEECYREHFDALIRAIGRVLAGAEQEAIAQDVFVRLFAEKKFRMSFQGGSLRSWLSTVARNRAIDYLRKTGRESPTEPEAMERLHGSEENLLIEKAEARRIIAKFKKDLPEKWHRVFEARFIHQLSQREAASELNMHRTTLAYQELRIRSRLRKFLLGGRKDR